MIRNTNDSTATANIKQNVEVTMFCSYKPNTHAADIYTIRMVLENIEADGLLFDQIVAALAALDRLEGR